MDATLPHRLQEFVWGDDSNTYAVRESSTSIKVRRGILLMESLHVVSGAWAALGAVVSRPVRDGHPAALFRL